VLKILIVPLNFWGLLAPNFCIFVSLEKFSDKKISENFLTAQNLVWQQLPLPFSFPGHNVNTAALGS